jgi:hypothetical protein
MLDAMTPRLADILEHDTHGWLRLIYKRHADAPPRHLF